MNFVEYASPGMTGDLPPAPPHVRRKGTGERVLTATLAGGVGYGWPGGWSQDRREQARHFKFWTYVAVSCIMEECARYMPHLGYVRAKDHKGGYREKMYRERRYQKTMQHIKPHEEIEPIEDDHPIMRLLEKPNAWDTAGLPDLIKEWVMFQCLMGNGYWWVIPHLLTGMPEQLFILPSHWVWARYNRNTPTGLEHYEIRPFIGPGQFVIQPDELIHTREKNPLHKIDGYSPQQAIDHWVDELESAHRARFWQFRNQTGLSGAIELPADYEDPDDQEMERIYAKIFSRLQGESNYGRPAILGPGMKFVPLKVTPVESDFIGTVEQLRDGVLAAWKVPKEVAGVQPSGGDLSWYAPLQQFVRNNIAPRLSYLSHVMTHSFCCLYDRDLRWWYDDPTPDNPEQVNRDLMTDKALFAISPNEVRAIRGREPWPGGDDPIGTASDVPIPMSTGLDFSGDDWATLVGAESGEEAGPGGGPELPSADSNGQTAPNHRPGGNAGAINNGAGKRLKKKSGDFHEEDHPRDESGQFGFGGGSKKPQSGGESSGESSRKKPPKNDPVHGYLEGFQDTSQEPATAQDARNANRDLRGEGSKFRVVPDGKGGWMAAHLGDLVDEYGERWMVAMNPLTGSPDVGDKDYFDELKPLAGDKDSRSYVHAFNDPSAPAATQEDADKANEELAADGSKFRLHFDENYNLWVARPAGGSKRWQYKADFHEEDHPRDESGRFGEGGGGGGKKPQSGGNSGGESSAHEDRKRRLQEAQSAYHEVRQEMMDHFAGEAQKAQETYEKHAEKALEINNDIDTSEEGEDTEEAFRKLDQAMSDVFGQETTGSRFHALGDVIDAAQEFYDLAGLEENQDKSKQIIAAAKEARQALREQARNKRDEQAVRRGTFGTDGSKEGKKSWDERAIQLNGEAVK